MPRFALHVAEPSTVSQTENAEHLYWRTDSDSTFVSTMNGANLGPTLGAFGPVNPFNVDAVRIAVATLAADRSIKRTGGGSNWNSRDFEVRVPVSDEAAWSAASSELGDLIGFLTGDRWTFEFVTEEYTPEPIAMATWQYDRVVLLSGGADSIIGGLLTRHELGVDSTCAFMSHFSSGWVAPEQRNLAHELQTLVPGPRQQHLQIHQNRRQQRFDGSTFRNEPSSRSRSFLFVTLGLAAASIDQVELWIPENGFASLNPPLGPDRLGSLSTKTTHPEFLGGLQKMLESVGAHADLKNPFANLTKGEMFGVAVDLVGKAKASTLLSATNSCAHTGHPGHRPSASTACGVCFGCIVRRAAFKAAGLRDRTDYADPAYSAPLADWLARESIVPVMRSFVVRGVRTKDLLAMSLPDSMSLEDAAHVCNRAIDELAGYCS